MTFNQINLVPSLCRLKSRSLADTSIEFGGLDFDLPVIPANMLCSMHIDLLETLDKSRVFHIMHRFSIDAFCYLENRIKFNSSTLDFVSFSTGLIIDKYFEGIAYKNKMELSLSSIVPYAKALIETRGYRGQVFVTIDVAHAHSVFIHLAIQEVKKLLPNAFVIVGNVATSEGVCYLRSWGADAVKVGIGGGRACITKNKTGFHVPMVDMLLELEKCSEIEDFPLIVDGGVKENGDIAKIICLLSRPVMVMMGSVFAGCKDSPAPKREENLKGYFGSASSCNGKVSNIEGKEIRISESEMTYSDKLKEIKEDLQSSISYAGGVRLGDLGYCAWRKEL